MPAMTDGSTEIRLHYRDPILRKVPTYRGGLDRVEEEEARALLSELLDYFGLASGFDMPWPPDGMIGKRDIERDGESGRIRSFMATGFSYAIEAMKQRPGALHARWERMGRLIDYERQRPEERHTSSFAIPFQEFSPPEASPPSQEIQVYFIQEGEDGPIKIGMAGNPEKRLKGLQTGHARQLRMLCSCPGGAPLEALYHRRYSKHHLQGEWFDPHPDILAEIDRLNTPSTLTRRVGRG